MNEQTLAVPDIHCDHCKMSIEDVVGQLDGVDAVTVDIPGRSVHVAFGEPAGLEDVIQAVESIGYIVDR